MVATALNVVGKAHPLYFVEEGWLRITDVRATLLYSNLPAQQHVDAYGQLRTVDRTLVIVINGALKIDRKRLAFMQKVVKKPQT